MKISLCLAVYNEEKNIHYPLDSAYDLVDEIVIVDGNSSDKTVKIAKSYGTKVKIFFSDNPLMFHKNKQKAIDAAKGDWILQLDADEALGDELKTEIRNIINCSSEFNGFWIPRKNWFLTRFLNKGGQYPDYTLRLYKKGTAYFPCRDVHENVIVKGKTSYLKKPILHYADPDFSRYLQRWDRYTSLEVEKILNSKSQKLFFLKYFFWLPAKTFFLMYFRHLGLLDSFPGFIFSLFSSIRFWVIYIKWWTKKYRSSNL